MSEAEQTTSSPWMELSEAAQFLGVHYTTLRRWADSGQVPCFRTPGGRRRFRRDELATFVASLRQGSDSTALVAGGQGGHVAHLGVSQEAWYGKLDESHRSAMRSEGQRLYAVLMQYATRSNGGQVFLEEGRRLATTYGVTCQQAGLSLVETVQAFVQVRRSIIDSVYQAGALAGSPDPDTWRLYDRMNHFLDSMLMATLEAFDRAANAQLSPAETQD